MKKNYVLLLVVLISQLSFSQAANDMCSTAENIVISTESSQINFDISTATINNESGCEELTLENYADIWYEFTMPTNGNVFVNGNIRWNNFALYSSCSSDVIKCGGANALFEKLTKGEVYLLRVFRTENNATKTNYSNFSIKVFETATNDTCDTAENIELTSSLTNIDFNIGGAEINNEMGCSGTSPEEYADIWYEFTMPVNGNLAVDATIGWNQFALFDTCNGTEIECGSAAVIFDNLEANSTYKLRLFRTKNNATTTSYTNFSIQALEQTINDTCDTATDLNVSTTIQNVEFKIGGSNINNEIDCSGATDKYADIWYNFTMPVDGSIYIDGSISWNRFAIYDTCESTEIVCESSNITAQNLTAGTTYKLRVFRAEDIITNPRYKSFSIQAFANPDNDTCTNAELINLTTESTTVNFEIGGAQLSEQENCLTGVSDIYGDIWYEFTMPVHGNIFVDGTITWNNFTLYDACDGEVIICDNDNLLAEGLMAGHLYKLQVLRTKNLTKNSRYQDFTIQAFPVTPNDTCDTAENLTISTTPLNIDFQLEGTQINNEIGCIDETTSNYADVWYSFTMPNNGNIYIDADISWNNFALYDTCNGNLLYCGTSAGRIENLLENTNYLLRIFRSEAQSTNASYQSFSIQIEVLLSTENLDTDNPINIYPNPVKTILNIASKTPIDSIEIFTILGQMVLKSSRQNSIEVNHLKTGIYLAKIQTENKKIIKRFMVN